MSSRIFQSVIVQMKEATDRMIGVIDADSNVISCSDTSLIGEKWPEAVIRLNSAPDSIVVVDKKTFKPLVSWSAYFDYAVFAEGRLIMKRSMIRERLSKISSPTIFCPVMCTSAPRSCIS